MKRQFQTIRDYHQNSSSVRVQSQEWRSARASILLEESNDVRFKMTARNGVVLTLDGTKDHLTHMASIRDETPTRPGDICLIPEGLDVHLAWTNVARLQETLMLEFDGSLFETYAPEIVTPRVQSGHLVPSGFAPQPEIDALTRLIAREADGARARGRLYAESAIRLLAIEIARSFWSSPAHAAPDMTGPDTRIHRALEFIETYFATDISLIEISNAAALSPTHLSCVFRRQTGITPYSYVVNRRLRHAVHLLRTTDMPIAHVALDAGFADQQHLSRVLRARHNRTPRQVRREG